MIRRRYDGDYLILADGSFVSAPPDTHDLEKVTKIFSTALRDVKNAVAARLGHTLEIVTISQPRHFNDSSHEALASAAQELEPHFQPMQIINFNTAARFAYNLTSCAGFGLSAAECEAADDLHFIINVEYYTSYLEIVMAYAHDIALNVKAHVLFMDLGEGMIKSHKSNTWLERIKGPQHKIPSNATLQHYQNIEQKLAHFLEEQQHAPVEGYNNLDDLRAVILSGDAPPLGFESLKTAVAAALGSCKGKLRSTIDPLYVGAVGAGERGRHQFLTPGFFDDHYCPSKVDDHSYREHDEL